jgi:retron-type reverse transcriptase
MATGMPTPSSWSEGKENRGAGGVDGMTVTRFDENRDHYLGLLHQKLKDGSYKPRPVLRVEIEREGSTAKRPLGIPPVMDRVCQQALVNVLEPIFEPTFRNESSAFAPDDRRTWPCGASGGS